MLSYIDSLLQDSAPHSPADMQSSQPRQPAASALQAAALAPSQPLVVVLVPNQPQQLVGSEQHLAEQQLAASALSAVLVPTVVPGWPKQVRDNIHTNCREVAAGRRGERKHRGDRHSPAPPFTVMYGEWP